MATRGRKPADLHKEDMDWIREKKLLRKTDYVETEGRQITAIFCKKCGTKIQGMIPDNRPPRITKTGVRIIEQRFVRLGPLPLFTEVEILCDDGSRHITPCCTNCAPFLTPDDLDAFLIADTESELGERSRSNLPMPERLYENRVMRRVRRT